MNKKENTKQWAQLEEVSVYGLMKLMFLLYILGGRLLFKVVLYPVVSYYFFSNKTARLASKDFLQRVEHYSHGKAINATLLNSYRQFIQFAESMIDKLDAWNNKLQIDDVVIHGREQIAEQLAQKQGGIILGSHLGNVEVCRALATIRKHAKLNILVHTKHAKHFNRLLNEQSSGMAVELIQVTDIGPGLAIILDQKVMQGEFVFIVGDRVPVDNNERTQTATFLGEKASFSQGPFILAALLKCPVYTLFCLKQQGVYHLYFDHFSDCIKLARKNRERDLENYIQLFADRLQHYCLLAPLQWFNFFPFWQLSKEQEQTL